MNKLFLVVVLMSVVLLGCTPRINTFQYRVTKENTTPRQFKQLLIVSAGAMSNRKTAQDLKYALDKQFKKLGVTTAYEHLGSAELCIPENIRIAAKKHPHDAVFVITPLGAANFIREIEYWGNGYDEKSRRTTSSETVIRGFEATHQTSILGLFDDTDFANPYWAADADLFTELAAERIYDKVAKGLIENWKKANIIAGTPR
jgi:hypothetical protein